MSLATKVTAKATRAIAKVGRTATVSIDSGGAYAPATGKVTGTTTTTASVTITPLFSHRRGMDSAAVRMSAGYFLVSSEDLTFTPTTGQKWTIGTETWTVLEVQRIAISSTDVSYRVTVEKGSR